MLFQLVILLEEEIMSLTSQLIGAGQWHHQAYYGTQLQDYLDYGPTQGDDL